MTNKNDSASNITYYVSPTGKVHADNCRYCQPDKEGWNKLDSFDIALEKKYQLCRLCCPSQPEIIPLDQTENQDSDNGNNSDNSPVVTKEKQEKEINSDTPISPQNDQVESDEPVKSEAKSEGIKSKNKDKGKSSNTKDKDKKKTSPEEKKRYKILAGNGCHQAIAELRGILIPPTEGEKSFHLILPDGLQLEATFKNPRLLWLAYNKPELLGDHWFRGYPKMKDDKLVSLQIIAWDGTMPTNPRGEETWEFTGVWTLQKNITVQRSMMLEDVRKVAEETGFIKKFKYTFVNSFDWVKNKKLWAGYVYKVLCKRKGDVLEIKKVIPYACPRIKPVPKQTPAKGNKPFNKGDKPKFSQK